jgi:hypothetical protein
MGGISIDESHQHGYTSTSCAGQNRHESLSLRINYSKHVVQIPLTESPSERFCERDIEP